MPWALGVEEEEGRGFMLEQREREPRKAPLSKAPLLTPPEKARTFRGRSFQTVSQH